MHGVGKVAKLFAGVGLDHTHPGPVNAVAIDATTALLRELDSGLVFANLVETDQVYGHRKDVEGFHGALREIDAAAGVWLDLLRAGRPARPHRRPRLRRHHPGDRPHARVRPLLAAFEGHDGRRHDGALADVGASCLRWLTGGDDARTAGRSFV